MTSSSGIGPADGIITARRVLSQLGVPQTEGAGPVTLGRELLLRAWDLVDQGGSSRDAQTAVISACAAFMAGVAHPDGSEYGGLSSNYAVADALMWFGIASGALVQANQRIPHLRERPEEIGVYSLGDPNAVGFAGFLFAELNEVVKAARCDEEEGEIFVLDSPGDPGSWASHKVAAAVFESAGEHSRAAAALRRLNGGSRLHSSFLTRRRWDVEEATTIAGSIEYQALRSAVML